MLPFDDWKAEVNKEVEARISLSCDDLPDVDYMSMWEDDLSPSEAAGEVISQTIYEGM